MVNNTKSRQRHVIMTEVLRSFVRKTAIDILKFSIKQSTSAQGSGE